MHEPFQRRRQTTGRNDGHDMRHGHQKSTVSGVVLSQRRPACDRSNVVDIGYVDLQRGATPQLNPQSVNRSETRPTTTQSTTALKFRDLERVTTVAASCLVLNLYVRKIERHRRCCHVHTELPPCIPSLVVHSQIAGRNLQLMLRLHNQPLFFK